MIFEIFGNSRLLKMLLRFKELLEENTDERCMHCTALYSTEDNI